MSIARIGSSVAPVGGDLLGPVGGIVGAVAGGLLGSLSKATPAATKGSFKDTSAAKRAALAEACLSSVLRLLTDYLVMKTIPNHMQRNYTANAPNVHVLTAAITPQITKAALDNTAGRYTNAVQAAHDVGQESGFELRSLGIETPESAFGDGAAFVEGLFGPTRPLVGEEGIFSWLGPVLKKASPWPSLSPRRLSSLSSLM
ncbi:hypothetical protein EsDP_00002100 [Epichloe bromicola]|uniref:Uncharacterized protein n=1 Tax=Epichloe bromicola TaxID=79588 RepID=A0ABQ0CJT1_9HYPO